MRILRGMVGGALLLGVCIAQADIMTIDPNSYAAGQIVTDPSGEARLSAISAYLNPDSNAPFQQEYIVQSSPVFASAVSSGCSGMYHGGACAPSGDKVFGYSPGAVPALSPILWGQGNSAAQCSATFCDNNGEGISLYPALRVDFAAPTDFVDAAIGFLPDPDGGWIEAFNSTGQQVGLCYGSPILGFNSGSGASSCATYPYSSNPAWAQFSISNSSDDISTVFIGGAGNFRPIGQLQYDTVPEPGTLALFGAGLLGLAWSKRRRLKFART